MKGVEELIIESMAVYIDKLKNYNENIFAEKDSCQKTKDYPGLDLSEGKFNMSKYDNDRIMLTIKANKEIGTACCVISQKSFNEMVHEINQIMKNDG